MWVRGEETGCGKRYKNSQGQRGGGEGEVVGDIGEGGGEGR